MRHGSILLQRARKTSGPARPLSNDLPLKDLHRAISPLLERLRPHNRYYKRDYTYRSFGAVRDYFTHEIRPTEMETETIRPLVELCRAARRFDPDFEFTTVQVNLNFSGQLHVDGSNRGPTLMLTLGDATGGDLWVHPNARHAARWNWILFDGTRPHCTFPYSGERVTVVFYTHCMWKGWEASCCDFKAFAACGYPLPTERGVATFPSGKRNRATLEKVVDSVPPELRDRIPMHLLANTAFALQRRTTASKAIARQRSLLLTQFKETGRVRVPRRFRPAQFVNTAEYERAEEMRRGFCTHPHHPGERLFVQRAKDTFALCDTCKSGAHAHGFSPPHPSTLPLPPASWLRVASPVATPNKASGLFWSEHEWVVWATTHLLDRMEHGKTVRAQVPLREMFHTESAFLAAYPLRMCTDAEHEGDRVMRFDSHHFASSNGRLTHCKQCKRRYIQKRRSVGK